MFSFLNGKINNFGISVANSSNSLLFIGESLKDRISNVQSFKKILSTYIPTISIIFLGLKGNSEALNFFNFKQLNLDKSFENNVNFFVKNEDNVFVRKFFMLNKNSNIWYNTHGSELSKKSQFVLPAKSHFEKEQIYINLENRPQKTLKVLEISKGCKDLTSILLSSSFFSSNINPKTSSNCFQYVYELAKDSYKFDNLKTTKKEFTNHLTQMTSFRKIKISKYPFIQKVKNFYLTDTFSQNSKIMQACSNELISNFSNF